MMGLMSDLDLEVCQHLRDGVVVCNLLQDDTGEMGDGYCICIPCLPVAPLHEEWSILEHWSTSSFVGSVVI